jgi:serine/threonine-protein kinase
MTAVPSEVSAALADRYAIERELGQGGMATVYLAEDLKHQRKVAIKVLRPELAAVLGANRFLQEIRTTAHLQHPNILPLFDSGEAGGVLYYVMPYIRGETLREKLDREKQLGIPEAVRITAEVAEALDYAHRQEVVHRDIKPENILLQDGRPVVADFGIALAVSAAAGGRMTETGLSLGTPHYMSPEQATAEKDITRRSDIYSLGAVLYEMLAGDPPHTGSSAQQIIMRIITEEPRPLTTLRHTVPPHVAAAVAKAIEKLPADRFDSAREFRKALEDPAFTHSAVLGATRVAAGALAGTPWLSDVRSKVAAGLVVLLGAALAGIVLSPRTAPDAIADRPVYHFVLRDSTGLLWPVVAPDGSVWIEAPTGAPHRRFLVRRPGATVWSEVATTEVAGEGIFAVSPDGRRAAYARTVPAGTEIRTISAESRQETLLATLSGRPLAWVTDWSEDGFIYVTAFLRTCFVGAVNLRVPETGGATLDTIPLLTPPGRFATWMKAIPGTDVILYAEDVPGGACGVSGGRILAYRLGTQDTVFVADGVIEAWSQTGHVLVGREGGFVEAVPFDPKAFRTTGLPKQVLAGVRWIGPAVVFFAGSRAGALAYLSGSEVQFELRWRGLDGASERIPIPATDHNDAAVSPDGARIAYVREGRIWIYDGRSGRDAPLSDDTLGTNEHDPLWSPDGRRLVFPSKRAGMADQGDLYVQVADGSGPAARIGGTPGFDAPLQWLGDSTILFVSDAVSQGDIYTVALGRPGSEKVLLESPFSEETARVDPSGRWLAYTSLQDGPTALYVRRYPSLENPVRVTSGDDFKNPPVLGRAVWSADGQSVFYVSKQDSLVRVTLDLSGERARVVSRTAVLGLGNNHDEITDRHPTDGRLLQWVIAGAEAEQAPPKLILIVNFDQEIRRIMGEGH